MRYHRTLLHMFLHPKTLSCILAVALGLLVFAETAHAFFPSTKPPPTNGGNGGGGNGGGGDSDGGGGGGGGNGGGGGADDGGGGGGSVPELDPGSIAGAMALLITGALMITDRRRRP